MPHQLVRILHIVCPLAWGLAIADLTPAVTLEGNATLFTVAVACVSSYALIGRANARPADEVFLVGKEMGRLEAEAEMRSGVTRLAERRLTVVGGRS